MPDDLPTNRLPRGPHQLSRAQVQASQRARMLSAMIDAVAEKGYVKTTVGDVLTRSGVSRATFYEQFDDKADCFNATYSWVVDLLEQVVSASVTAADAPSDPIEKIDSLVGFYLAQLTQSPALAKVFLVEVYAAGPAVINLRRRTVDSFVDLIMAMFADDTNVRNDPDLTFNVRLLVSALVAMVTEAIALEEPERLADLRRPFHDVVSRTVADFTNR